jgi:hypothetical protein
MITGVTADCCDDEFTPPGLRRYGEPNDRLKMPPIARGRATMSNIDSAMQGSDGFLKSLIEL